MALIHQSSRRKFLQTGDCPRQQRRETGALRGRGELIGEMVGRGKGKDALVALGDKGPFQQAATLVVQEILVPMFLDEFRDDNDDTALRMVLRELKNKLNDGNDDETIG